MLAKVLPIITALTLILEIVLTNLGYRGVLGYGDTPFIWFVWIGGIAACVAVVAALGAIAWGIAQHCSVFCVICTAVLAALSVAVFLLVLEYGPRAILWWC